MSSRAVRFKSNSFQDNAEPPKLRVLFAPRIVHSTLFVNVLTTIDTALEQQRCQNPIPTSEVRV
eukprot:6120931-Amphidinium_carterae.1